jgi:hypothetical protein
MTGLEMDLKKEWPGFCNRFYLNTKHFFADIFYFI